MLGLLFWVINEQQLSVQAQLFIASSDMILFFMWEGGFLDAPRRDKSSRQIFKQGMRTDEGKTKGNPQHGQPGPVKINILKWPQYKNMFKEPSLHSTSQA